VVPLTLNRPEAHSRAMNSSVPQPRVSAAAKIALGMVVGAYTDLLDRKDRLAYAMSMLCQIDAARAEMATFEPGSGLVADTSEAIAVVQALSDELKRSLREP